MKPLRTILEVLLLAILAFSLAGCGEDKKLTAAGAAPPPPPPADISPVRTYDYTQTKIESGKRGTGRRWTVAILRFGDTREVEDQPYGPATQPSGQQSGDVNVNVKVVGVEAAAAPREVPPQMNKRAREMLKHALVKSEDFTVLERERILEVLREINFGKSKYVDPESAGEEGNLLAVRYLIEGSVGLNEDKSLKDTIDTGPGYKDADYQPGFLDNVFNRGKVDQHKRMMALQQLRQQRVREHARAKFDTACYLSAYDVYTGQVVASVMGLGTNGLEAIDDAVDELSGELAGIDKDPRVVAVSGEKIYLDRGKGLLKVGDKFQVVHHGQPIRDRENQVIGYEETEVGEIEVVEVRDLMSVARAISKAGQIGRGDLAKPAKH